VFALLIAFHAAPAGLAFGLDPNKACCRTKDHHCCNHAAQKTEPGDRAWTPAGRCHGQCSLAAGFAFSSHLFGINRSAAPNHAVPSFAWPARQPERRVLCAYAAFLYQRPPPVL
jgi:hypothetical protein